MMFQFQNLSSLRLKLRVPLPFRETINLPNNLKIEIKYFLKLLNSKWDYIFETEEVFEKALC